MSAPPREPSLERLIARLDARLYRLDLAGVRFAWARLLAFAGGAVVSAALLFAVGVWAAFIAAAVAVILFSILARFHRRIKTSTLRHHVWRDIKRAHLARSRLDWDHLPPPLAADPRPECPL